MSNSYDEHLVSELSEHAATEALAAVQRIAFTASEEIRAEVLVKAFAKIEASILRSMANTPKVFDIFDKYVKEDLNI